MQCLVTGGAGFIGSHLVERLVADGHQVRVFDDLSAGQLPNLASVRGQIDFVQGSITDLDMCNKVTQDMDVVFHHAAVVPVQLSIENPQRTHDVNANGTLNVLLAAKYAGVRRVVVASSAAIYGDAGKFPVGEELTPQPISPYGVTKTLAEGYCLSKSLQFAEGPSVVILRYFNVYGPRQNPRSQYGGVIPRFITAVLANKPPIIYGSGQQIRDFVYVTDVVEANLAAATYTMADEIQRTTVFNIASGRWTSINQLWKVICWLTRCELQATYHTPRRGDIDVSTANISKAQLILRYHPLVELATGLRATIEWYRAFYKEQGYYAE